MMTYFGVNFYLAGLHSYAKDDQEISVTYIVTALVIITTTLCVCLQKTSEIFQEIILIKNRFNFIECNVFIVRN